MGSSLSFDDCASLVNSWDINYGTSQKMNYGWKIMRFLYCNKPDGEKKEKKKEKNRFCKK